MARDGFQPSGDADTGLRLLQAACELVGGEDQLAKRLNMSRLLLKKYMAGRGKLPESLLLRTVDLLLEEREARFPHVPREPADGSRRDSDLPA